MMVGHQHSRGCGSWIRVVGSGRTDGWGVGGWTDVVWGVVDGRGVGGLDGRTWCGIPPTVNAGLGGLTQLSKKPVSVWHLLSSPSDPPCSLLTSPHFVLHQHTSPGVLLYRRAPVVHLLPVLEVGSAQHGGGQVVGSGPCSRGEGDWGRVRGMWEDENVWWETYCLDECVGGGGGGCGRGRWWGRVWALEVGAVGVGAGGCGCGVLGAVGVGVGAGGSAPSHPPGGVTREGIGLEGNNTPALLLSHLID